MMDNSYLIIDRIEGEIAVCEDSAHNHFHIRLTAIYGEVREGDLLYYDPAGGCYVVDLAATEQRRNKLFQRQQALFQRNGDKDAK